MLAVGGRGVSVGGGGRAERVARGVVLVRVVRDSLAAVPALLAIHLHLLRRQLGEERVELRVRLALGTRRRGGKDHGHRETTNPKAVTRTGV